MWWLAAAWSSSTAPPGVSLVDLVARHRSALATIDAASCQPTLQAFFDDLEAIDPAAVDRSEVADHGARLIADVFAYRVEVQHTLRRLYDHGALTPGCVQGARRADLAGRYLQDALYLELGEAAPGEWIVAPGVEMSDPTRDLRSGDVIVSRGAALSSAGIAHMGRIDGLFSHNMLVWRDPLGAGHTVEAYLEQGALTQSLDDFLHHGLGRIVVLRYHDPAFAEEAARRAWSRVHDGEPMDYDADFDPDDHAALFCSEVVPWAFVGMMDDGPSDLPYDLTVFDKEHNAGLFDAMGIEVDVTSAPADVLFDPRFEIVAEWRDLAELERMRLDDVVVESLFHWMEDRGYRLHSPGFDRFFVKFGLTMRRMGFFRKRIHPHGDVPFLTASLSLQYAGLAVREALTEALEGRDTREMTYQDLRDVLESIREADLATFTAGGKARFHDRLRPD
ncbi:MAG: YiiX/YebB-like N1pC/P60 family cysteine hydrolase [Myxococcota bacterium]